jgi:ppGpp synthetase/RelA/SpoT-type nucleotidyltranferase
MAEYLKKLLEYARGPICETAIVQARPKSPASAVGKVVKRWPVYQDIVTGMTDLCGARVIVSLPRQAAHIASWIRSHLAIRQYEDMLERLKPEAFGYRGEHFLVNINPRLLPPELVSTDVLNKMPPPTSALKCPSRQADSEAEIEKLRSRLLLCEGPPVLDADLWRELCGLTAEIQVRTMAQHVWSDVGHDLIYKSPMMLPEHHLRSSAKVAAMLEAVDEEFEDLVEKLERIQKNARRYIAEEEAEKEIARLSAILSVDTGNPGIACNLVRLQLSIADYDGAERTINEFQARNGDDHIELRVLRGRVLVAKHREFREDRRAFESGRSLLASFVDAGHGGVEAATALAEAWAIDGNRDMAFRAFEKAYRMDASDPRALTGFLRYQVADAKGTHVVRLFRPDIERGIQRCREQIAARANLPDALFLLAELLLVSEESHEAREAERKRRTTMSPEQRIESKRRELQSTYEGLYATCRAITLTPRRQLAAMSEFCSRMDLLQQRAPADVPGAEWVRKIVLLACSLRSRDDEQMKKVAQSMGCLRDLKGVPLPIDGKPVLIIAGGCDMSDEKTNKNQRMLLKAMTSEFEGLILSGGTRQGIAGLVGELCRARNAEAGHEVIRSIGYLPENIADEHATKDNRYTERHRRTYGWIYGFSPLEPIQNWIDLSLSAVDGPASAAPALIAPEDVRLLGIGGGKIAAFEYYLASALGAQTAVIRGSGRAADRLADEENQPGNENIMFLPSDVETVRAYVGQPPSMPEIEQSKEKLADEINSAYNDYVKSTESKRYPDDIKKTFRRSNMEQAQHIAAKLRRVGLEVAPLSEPRAEQPIPEDAVEELAKMEHGRWIVERTLIGWRWGPVRDNDKKTRPQLIPWNELPEDEKGKDRHTVEKIPGFLRKCGLKIVKAERR